MIRTLLDGRLVCEPFDDATGRGYSFTAPGTYRRFIRELESVNFSGGPNGIRTRVSALRRPGYALMPQIVSDLLPCFVAILSKMRASELLDLSDRIIDGLGPWIVAIFRPDDALHLLAQLRIESGVAEIA